MEENNNNRQEEMQNYSEKHICFHNHCWKKCLGMLVASFLGGFLAFYFVMDQTMHRLHRPPHFKLNQIERKMINDIDRMYQQDMEAFENAFNPDRFLKKFGMYNIDMPEFVSDTIRIKSEYNDNKYDVIVDLTQFNNDENRIKYNANGRKLTVSGKSKIKEKDFAQDIAFSQDFILPRNADINGITKIKNGNKLIISVPLKNE